MGLVVDFQSAKDEIVALRSSGKAVGANRKILLVDESCNGFADIVSGARCVDREFEICNSLRVAACKIRENPKAYICCLVSRNGAEFTKIDADAYNSFEFHAFERGIPVKSFEGIRPLSFGTDCIDAPGECSPQG